MERLHFVVQLLGRRDGGDERHATSHRYGCHDGSGRTRPGTVRRARSFGRARTDSRRFDDTARAGVRTRSVTLPRRKPALGWPAALRWFSAPSARSSRLGSVRSP